MIATVADLVSRAIATVRGMAPFALVVRSVLLVDAVLLALACGAADHTGNPLATVLVWLLVAAAVGSAALPDTGLPAAPSAFAAVWVLLVHPSMPWTVGVALLLWLGHVLARWASLAPVHGRIGAPAVAVLLRDAALELVLVAVAGVLLYGGAWLGRRLPGGALWALVLLAALVLACWWAVPGRRLSRPGGPRPSARP